MSSIRGQVRTALVLVLASVGGACPGPSGRDAGLDSAADVWLRVDGGRTCLEARDCDDGLPCSIEACTGGRCFYATDPAVCSDGIFCNGAELCDLERGCIAGTRETCDDRDVCTADRCVEAMAACEHLPRDVDGDGDPDAFCAGGDCADFDPRRSSLRVEACGDGFDNDCDLVVDESACARAPYDRCEDAMLVAGDATLSVSLRGAGNEASRDCLAGARADVVLAVDLGSEPVDLRVRARGNGFIAGLRLVESCAAATSLACERGTEAVSQLRGRTGRVYVVVAGVDGVGEAVVTIERLPATMAPENERCVDAMPIETGVPVPFSMLEVADDARLGCGFEEGRELFYRFEIPEAVGPRDVQVVAGASGRIAFELLAGCDGTSLRCAAGQPARGKAFRLPPGTYVLALEGPMSPVIEGSFTVQLLDPSDPVLGDQCASPIGLTLGEPYVGSLSRAEDDLATRCASDAVEMLHRFELETPSDVVVRTQTVRGTAFTAWLDRCPGEAAVCGAASGFESSLVRYGLPAGTHWLAVEATTPLAYLLTVEARSPRAATEVRGADTCEEPFVVPEGGGLFTGTLAALTDQVRPGCGSSLRAPDALFRLEISRPTRLVATTTGSHFDTILSLRGAVCTDEFVCSDEDGGGGAGRIESVLNPGRYYLSVDAWEPAEAGRYYLDVSLTDPGDG